MDVLGTTPFADLGALGLGNVNDLVKALTTGYGTDVAAFTGGQALRVQSLDQLLYDTIWADRHIQLFKLLKRTPIQSTVDEWTERSEYGSPYGGVSGEANNPVSTSATLARKTGNAKFYRTYREVSHVATIVRNIIQAVAEEEQAGTRFLLGNLERDVFFGDSSIIPEQIDGILPVVVAAAATGCIQNLNGVALDNRDYIHDGASTIGSYAGVPTHFFADPFSKTDIDKAFLGSERFIPQQAGDGQLQVDLGIGRLATSYGVLQMISDIFLAPERGWFNETTPLHKAPTTSRGGDTSNPAPAAPTVLTSAAAGADGTIPAGNYFYRVSSINCNGESASLASIVQAVGATNHVTLTITHTDAAVKGFRIYRTAKNAASAADCRYLYQCVALVGGVTTWVDTGTWVPGTTVCFMVDANPLDSALDWRQLMPMMKLDLAIVKPAIPWLQMIYGFLRVTRPKRLVIYKNVLPSLIKEGGWNPLGT